MSDLDAYGNKDGYVMDKFKDNGDGDSGWTYQYSDSRDRNYAKCNIDFNKLANYRGVQDCWFSCSRLVLQNQFRRSELALDFDRDSRRARNCVSAK